MISSTFHNQGSYNEKMHWKLCCAFTIIFLVPSIKSADIGLIDALENLNSRKLVQGLANGDNVNSTCKDHIQEYLKGILNETWAQLMFDSSAKVPDGVLAGNIKFLGHFDECLSAEHPEHLFTGQHCMLAITIASGNNNNNNGLISYYDLKATDNSSTSGGLSILYALCLPSTCSPHEIESGLNNLTAAAQLEGFLSFALEEQNCWTTEDRKLRDGDWVVVGFLVAVGVIAILSTIYDVVQRFIHKNDKPHPLLISFSIYNNGRYLFHISESSAQMKALHGLRTLSMCWVVLCHTYSSTLGGAIVNLNNLMITILTGVDHLPITNGFVSVDTFFFLSGLLVCFVFFRDISKKKYYDVPLSYIHRYIRLTAPLAVMLLLQSTIIPYFNKGPMWHSVMDSAADICIENWWYGLLYVQNYMAPMSTCLGQSWYLSADMQMYWIAPFILYPLWIWPKFGPGLLGILVLGAGFTTFAIAYVNHLGPNLLISPDLAEQFKLDYVPFHTRMAPWLIGIAVGYIICGIQAKKIKVRLTPFWIIIGWLTATGLCLGSIYGVKAFMGIGKEYTALQSAFYLAFHRIGWGLGLAWIVFACVQGYGGPINTFLSWNVFQPLGKLSYCVFLIHMSIQLYRTGTQRTSIYEGDLETVYFFLGDLVLATLISIPFTLLFEIPFGNIDKYLFQNVRILPLPWPKKSNKLQRKNEGKSSSNEDENNNRRHHDNDNDVETGQVNEGFQKDEKATEL